MLVRCWSGVAAAATYRKWIAEKWKSEKEWTLMLRLMDANPANQVDPNKSGLLIVEMRTPQKWKIMDLENIYNRSMMYNLTMW